MADDQGKEKNDSQLNNTFVCVCVCGIEQINVAQQLKTDKYLIFRLQKFFFPLYRRNYKILSVNKIFTDLKG